MFNVCCESALIELKPHTEGNKCTNANPLQKPVKGLRNCGAMSNIMEDASMNNEYEYENDFKPYSKSFSQLSMLAMTPSSRL